MFASESDRCRSMDGIIWQSLRSIFFGVIGTLADVDQHMTAVEEERSGSEVSSWIILTKVSVRYLVAPLK